MAVHPIVIEIFQSGPKWWTNRQTNIAIHRAARRAKNISHTQNGIINLVSIRCEIILSQILMDSSEKKMPTMNDKWQPAVLLKIILTPSAAQQLWNSETEIQNTSTDEHKSNHLSSVAAFNSFRLQESSTCRAWISWESGCPHRADSA